MTTTDDVLPMLIETVRVERVTRISPSFVRFELGGAGLADFGVEGPLYDQRIKLVFPHQDGPVPSFAGADESWYADWLGRPVEERGHMRTYTVRDVVGEGAQTRLVVDIVLHGDGPEDGQHSDGQHGEAGPGASWAARAQVGDQLVTLAPRRGTPYGGIEWEPGDADHLLLVGDETAVPAVASVLATLAAAGEPCQGAAFLEVPLAGDIQDLVVPQGIEVTWVVRDHTPYGERLHAAVVAHLGGRSTGVSLGDDEVDTDLWETPVWSSSGEAIEEPGTTTHACAWTGSTPGSRGRPRRSPGCAARWSPTSVWTAGRWHSWATGASASP